MMKVKKIKKNMLGVFNGSFLRDLLGDGHSFFYIFEEGLVKNSLRNPLIYNTSSLKA